MITSFGGKAPEVSPESWVAPTATIVGDVRIGAHSSIWFGAVVRADAASIVIGVETNLQDNCVLHADVDAPMSIGDRVSVGHGAVLHGCTIEADVLVGMGATVLNHAHVGQGSLVAAGALLLEGTEVPPGSLVAGVPGKVRRPLTDEELDHILKNGRAYVEFARQYSAAEAG